MMTSRAEYRLMLRQDNADKRLTPIGYEVGLISEKRYKNFLEKYDSISKEIERVKHLTIKPTDEVNNLLVEYGTTKIDTGVKLSDLIKRTELDYEKLAPIDLERPVLSKQVKEEVNIEIKYEGYIKLQQEQIDNFKKLEERKLTYDIDYEQIKGIRIEARQKLNKYKPESIGQASRISGISPADISVLLIYLHEREAH